MRSGAGAALRSPTDEAARSRCAPLAEQIGARAMVPAIGVAAKAVTTLAMSGPSAEPQPDSARIRPTLIRRVTSRRRRGPFATEAQRLTELGTKRRPYRAKFGCFTMRGRPPLELSSNVWLAVQQLRFLQAPYLDSYLLP